MGDAAYERAATPDEIERMCDARARGDRGGRGGVLDELLVRAPRRRRQARAEPLRRARRGRRRCSSRRAKRARAWCSSRRASSAPTPTCTSGSRASGARSPTRCSRRRAASTSSRCGCTRTGSRTARSVWPQVTPRPLTMQFTLADPYSLNTGQVFGELMKVSRAGAPRGVPRSRVAGARPRPTSRSRR